MDLGFETIGNACIICHDRGPVLATDPWLLGPAYFGSWALSHEVPPEQFENVKKCRYLWISHGHPDHLSLPSLEHLRDKQILLADHHGGRIARELRGLGFQVTVLKDGVWTELSPRLRIASVANYNQDAVLLIDLDGHLVVDANDAGDRGASRFLRAELPRFKKHTFLACLTGYGDADMIHVFDEAGDPVLPLASQRQPIGPQVASVLHAYGIRFFLPSSAMHVYQRTDSAWANAYKTPVTAHGEGFHSDRGAECLPAFVRYDLGADRWQRIDPKPTPDTLHAPEEYGDDWHTPLERSDVAALRAYFAPISHLQTCLGFLRFRVGGVDRTIDINKEHKRGFTFATPRQSLMQAVEWQAFDDLMIGNFTKTVAHGDFHGHVGGDALYPDFTPFVCKFADNGGAKSPAEIRAYLADYVARGFTDFTPTPLDPPTWLAMQRTLACYL